MALPVFQRTVVTNNGDIVANAEVTVFGTATGLPVDLFSDRTGATPLQNPFFTGSSGLAKFYANPGVVNITASGSSGSITWTDVHLIDSADIITIGQNFAAVENVSDNLADIQTVEQNLTAINATADNITDITTTAANITAVQTASDNIQAIIDAPQAATDAESARDTAIATLDEFKGQYYGSLASDPTLDPLGNPVSQGDIYWNSTAGELRAYNGSSWEPATATASNVGYDNTVSGLDAINTQQMGDEIVTLLGLRDKRVQLTGGGTFTAGNKHHITDSLSYSLPDTTGLSTGVSVVVTKSVGQAPTVTTFGTEEIVTDQGNVASIELGSDSETIFIWNATNWELVAVDDANGFTQSFATSGWQKLPSGLIIQWGKYGNGTTSTAQTNIVFPVAFPVAIVNIQLSLYGISGGSGVDRGYFNIDSRSINGFSVQYTYPYVDWFAIGY